MFLGLQPRILIIAAVCATLGTVILSRFTMSLGFVSYLLNILTLFAGAVAVNILDKIWLQPLDYSLQRPLIASIIGILLASLAMLVFIGPGQQND